MPDISQIEKLLKEGIALQQSQQPKAAIQKYNQVLASIPDQIDALYFKSRILYDRNDWEGILDLFDLEQLNTYTHVNPATLANCYTLLASTYQKLLRWNEAETSFKQAIRADEPTVDQWADLAQCQIEAGKIKPAQESVYSGKKLNIQSIRLMSAEAEICWRTSQVESCTEFLQQAIALEPTNLDLVSQYLFTLNYVIGDHEHEAAQKHLAIGQALENYYRSRIKETPSPRQLSTSIRVGFISPDLREHSVSYFLLPLLKGLKNIPDIKTFCYSTQTREDKTTGRIRMAADHFQNLTKTDIVQSISADALDILIDLAGHSAGNAIGVLLPNAKLAPIYMNWLGYANTTGFPMFDYRLVDATTDIEEMETIAEKRLYINPIFLCYEPPKQAPEVNQSPALNHSFFTLGCLNNLNKITEKMLSLWVKLLSDEPTFRLLLKSPMFEQNSVRQRILHPFIKAGIKASRIVLLKRTADTYTHLSTYHQIDLAMDTFPYNGTTTTCESLYMGCPVVSIAGCSHRSRVSASILTQLGRKEWIASSEEDYLSTIKTISKKIKDLADTRQSLRKELQESSVCDQSGFAVEFAKKCRIVTNK